MKAGTRDPAIDIRSVRWERVQLVIEACAAAGTTVDPERLRLTEAGGRRSMLFFAADLDEYIGSRDFYVPFETFVPGRIVRTFPELLDAIRRDDYQVEKVAPFVARHFTHVDGGSSDRVIDRLILAP